ncbi:DNA adenine methylase [Micromonospora sp. WMMD712]|uniref:DNA adenine methylase n=1 Tax=Micromonospora sp. WMMD712 TaxID=3016096 RepID=UPI00249C01E3|nr:DNA adenine methylase [Micromonospora sp. WMMD712]WFE59660.1 DNA adenine methylase [Micromonospora sp. WMMD712]
MTVDAFKTKPSRLKRPAISPLRYPGGKASLYTRLRALLRYNGLTSGTYVEPYAGGAGAALGLLVTGQVKDIVINDLDPAIFAFWKFLIDSPSDFSQMIREARLSVAEWEKQRDAYLHTPHDDYHRLGFATFYLNRTNRSGVLNGGPIGGMDQTGNYKIDARFNKNGLIERVRLIGMYSKRIAVHNMDGIALIKQYIDNPSTLVYADPPYFEKAGSLYLNSFTSDDHQALAACLNGLKDRRWLLTYDNVPQVSHLYGERRSEEFSLNYSAHRVMKAKEIMVYSDALVIGEERLL